MSKIEKQLMNASADINAAIDHLMTAMKDCGNPHLGLLVTDLLRPLREVSDRINLIRSLED